MKLSDGLGGGRCEGEKRPPRPPRQPWLLEPEGGRVIRRNPGPEGVWGWCGGCFSLLRKGLGMRLMSGEPLGHGREWLLCLKLAWRPPSPPPFVYMQNLDKDLKPQIYIQYTQHTH